MPRLKCESCGLVYSLRAITRELALATGVTCRRCGGTLAGLSDGNLEHRDAIAAVPSAATGHERLPFG